MHAADSLSLRHAWPNMSRGVFMRNLHLPSSASAGGQAMVRWSKSSGLNLFLTILLCVLAGMASSVLLTAQQSAPSSHPAAQGYPVTVEGHEVFRIYEAFGPISAHDRAEKVSERLSKLVYTPSADLSSITENDSEYGTEIRLGDNVLTIVSDNDAERMHVARPLLAQYYADQIRKAVLQARQEHSARFLIKAAIYALVTLLIYLLVVWLVVAGSRRLLKRLQRSDAPLVKGIKIQQSEILGGERIASLMAGAVRLLRVALLLIVTWVFLGYEFSYFPWTRVHGRHLLDYVLTPVRFVGYAFLDYLP